VNIANTLWRQTHCILLDRKRYKFFISRGFLLVFSLLYKFEWPTGACIQNYIGDSANTQSMFSLAVIKLTEHINNAVCKTPPNYAKYSP
jgi:hypothetical protein